MNRFRRVFCGLLAACMLFVMNGCSGSGDSPIGDIVDNATDAVTDTDQQPTEPTQPTVDMSKNIITGKDDMKDCAMSRPVGIMIANNDFIQADQVGLSTADMWMEAETEGGITRIMAVYASPERVPEEIGPVRSARSPFFHVVEALEIGYAHAGGSYTALNKIAHSDIADMDVDTDEGGAYSWRDEAYPYDYEYCLRTSGEDLTQFMQDREYQTTAVRAFPWTFGEASGETAEVVRVDMSSMQRIGFDYNSEEGVYYKLNGESRHCDSSITPITTKNVLVLYSEKSWENEETIDFALDSGKGYVFSNGLMRRFDWSRDENGFTMNEEDGTQLKLARGKVYLCVVSTEYESDLQYGAE